jgi:hypothetical protein
MTVMSLVEPPPVRPGDNLDGLLRAFFRSQLPHPWPSPPRPAPRTVPARPGRPGRALFRSRLALAATVALLFLGSLLLPGRLSQIVPSDTDFTGGKGTADVIERNKMRQNKGQNPPVKNKSGLSAEDDPDMLDLPDR